MIGREAVDEASGRSSARSFRLGEIIEGEHQVEPLRERVRVLCIPVRFEGQVIGVLTRETPPSVGRQPGELERVYVEIFNHFAPMIAAGSLPVRRDGQPTSDEPPRVGDGVMLLDREPRVSLRLARTPCRPCTASASTPTPRHAARRDRLRRRVGPHARSTSAGRSPRRSSTAAT